MEEELSFLDTSFLSGLTESFEMHCNAEARLKQLFQSVLPNRKSAR